MSSFQDQPEYDDELFTLARNDDYEGIFRVIAERKGINLEHVARQQRTHVIETQCPCCMRLIRVGVHLNGDVIAAFVRDADESLKNAPRRREWKLRTFGGTTFADGYLIDTHEGEVHVIEVMKAKP